MRQGSNLQNVQPQPDKLPTVRVDRGGGQSWPSYDIPEIVIGGLRLLKQRAPRRRHR